MRTENFNKTALSAKLLGIYPHQCRTLCSDKCFSIFDHSSTTLTLQIKIKEAIHIQWEQPTLNRQLYYVNLKLV
ncbi:hypothetical protein pdam_00023949, partial [Pocillopora damicornis]